MWFQSYKERYILSKKKINSLENKFIVGDCVEVLKCFPPKSVDFVLTSPPYADQRDYGTDNSSILPDNYISWFTPKARQIKRVLKDNGSFVININDKIVDGFQHLYVFELVIFLCKKMGFHLVRDYIWYNPATPPNIFSRGGFGRTKKSHEYCFWFSKGQEWTFNLDAIRKPYGKDMGKFLQGKGKGDRAQNIRPSTHNFNCEKVWVDNGGSDPGTVITLSNTNSNDVFSKLCKEKGIVHPARFPEKLAEFFILAGTVEDALVLDPFSGSGTTAISAARNNRRWIGIDTNVDYCNLAIARMNNEIGGVNDD